jgi:hypothetical protein
MITLSILSLIWGLYSIYKIYTHNHKRGTPFDIDEINLIHYMGVIALASLLITLIGIYLP